MGQLKNVLREITFATWDDGTPKRQLHARESIASIPTSKTSSSWLDAVWSAVEEALSIMAKRGRFSTSTRVYETLESSKSGCAYIMAGSGDISIEAPNQSAANSIRTMIAEKTKDEDLESTSRNVLSKKQSGLSMAWLTRPEIAKWQIEKNKNSSR